MEEKPQGISPPQFLNEIGTAVAMALAAFTLALERSGALVPGAIDAPLRERVPAAPVQTAAVAAAGIINALLLTLEASRGEPEAPDQMH